MTPPLTNWRICHPAIPDPLLLEYERVALNAMEERVLPPDVRIKIVVAQANVGDDEEEMEHEVSKLENWTSINWGMVRYDF